ncbi:putative transcription factor interactor and regulator FHA-SMAD family [Helianthus annuus]|uniref:Forkhead-associated (FHA) domain, SMAD/FHA domain superfamily n=1 Tax=Helianthus annuus TaxID=4232 RepID=A0A251VBY0_HELAN|nr:myosin-11 isoform X2 [Helianthus annuus]KAF5816775.1 putative forkhead-associated (FHA) domain, SMAD/FHA domain superfamily [Helianthus annuus]KAJ0610040.1 putative transcription factor interactor and regulator FHA-SMAD family [Helianthus annuus]KAJ0775820.1 putative transcription factor interactor and regulator FHA-SMAD family [Helianthus annuus]KAJ0938123.1 putative transcription factor interactor and regulator FHA-SMAD family [Helianthus annuus]KAJ0946020.1 putative transcription factor 
MATNGDDNNLQVTPISSKPSPSPNPSPISGADSSSKSPSPQDFILSVASKIASQPLQYSDPDVWAVLTAISTKARQRRQGINMLLTSDEHLIGRTVADTRFQILSNQISQQHCKIYRKKIATEDAEGQSRLYNCGFLKDTSTNGTYLNWEKLNKNSPESKLHHGDIISFAAPPQHEVSYAFVFREVLKPTLGADSLPLKRKADEFGSETKRLKGIGIGASDGPISLDDFRKLQRSNTELRKQLEDQVATINQLQNEHRAATELHEVEKKNLEESISKTYVDELKEIRDLFEAKQKELVEVNKINSEQKHAMVDLNERLNASIQSCTEANEIVRSQNASIAELKALLDEEREQRKEDREKAVENLTASIQRVKAEAQEELKRVSDASLRRENEQQEIINKLQESEKERCSLVETLRTKLEDTRQKLVGSDNKVRQLESQLSQEQRVSSTTNKRVQELEQETSRLRKELESEKAAREEAWAKVSALELEINAAMRDLEYEKRRLKAARERIMLRETQLRAFYSTTEEISSLFAKQQEQLKAMQRTLEDEENYENISVDINPNTDNTNQIDSHHQNKEAIGSQCSGGMKVADSTTSTKKRRGNQAETSSDEASVTEKHECDARNQETCEETQEAEFPSFDPSGKGAFGSDIDGGNAAAIETEQVMETETQNIDLNKLAGDTMVIDDEEERVNNTNGGENLNQSKDPIEEDTEAGDTIRTTDLLASEVAGSWACDTAPSCHGENDSPGSGGGTRAGGGSGGGGVVLHDSASVAAESQTGVVRNPEHEKLTKMIEIVEPEMKGQFGGTIESDSEKDVASNSDTEDCTGDDGGESDEEIEGHRNLSKNDRKVDETMDEDDDDDEATQQDSG